MKRKLCSLITAMALCSGLLIPAAFAEESPKLSQEEGLSKVQFTFDQANGTRYSVGSGEASAFAVEQKNVLRYDTDDEEIPSEETMSGYYAMKSNTTFTVAHTGTEQDGSSITIYLWAYRKGADGVYTWEDYPHGMYLTEKGTFLNDAMDPSDYGGLKCLYAGDSVQFQIPTDQWDGDTIYRVEASIYYPQYDWSYWKDAYFKVDEAGVAAGLNQQKPDTGIHFSDVASDAWYAKQVAWAVEKGITSGTGDTTFSPERVCSTGEILTFLWRAAGSPEPTIANPFTDVAQDAFYFKPALWAYEKGLVSGTVLEGDALCTRAATVTYLWKLAGAPAAQAPAFADVSADADYAAAVRWAVDNGITGGISSTEFGPAKTCTRGQIVTFLYADFAK